MKQLVYRSRPFGFDRAMLAGILSTARLNNRRDGITGALICRHDLYLQLIEGPAPAIDALFTRIAADDRHCEVQLLLDEQGGERIFPQWEMLDDQMPSLLGPVIAVDSGPIDASGAVLRALFTKLAVIAAGGQASPA